MTGRRTLRPWLSYWPHAGLALALLMNAVGLTIGNSYMIATASNLLVVAGLGLAQRKRNEKRE